MNDKVIKRVVDKIKKNPIRFIEELPDETKVIFLSNEEKSLLTGNQQTIVAFCMAVVEQILGSAFNDYLQSLLEKARRPETPKETGQGAKKAGGSVDPVP